MTSLDISPSNRGTMIDALVIGGGPSGAAFATLAARAGREVVLVEREPGPADKLCGEFISREAALYVRSLGIDLASLGARSIHSMRLVGPAGSATAPLPFAAWSLSRRVLDEAILERAAAAGATILRGAKARELTPSVSGYRARIERGPTIEARAAFLATGKHNLHGLDRRAGTHDDLVAFKMHFRLAAAAMAELEGHVELVFFEDGYATLQPIEGGGANLCLLVRRRRLAALEARWDRLLAALRSESRHIEARLAGAEACWARPLALAAIPYGYVLRRGGGVWRLGDQAVIVPSFAGDGISIALHSARLAAGTYLSGEPAGAFQRRLSEDVTRQVHLATALSHALVHRSCQTALGAAARLAPGLLAAVAECTRVPEDALARAGLRGAA